jgi:single-stranded DNA-binding protein
MRWFLSMLSCLTSDPEAKRTSGASSVNVFTFSDDRQYRVRDPGDPLAPR